MLLPASVALGLLVACDAPARSDDSAAALPGREIEVTLADFPTSPAVRAPFRVAATTRHIWISDAAGDPGLHALDASTLEVRTSIGRVGNGPNDFNAYPTRLQADPIARDVIWVFDANNRRLGKFTDDAILADERRFVDLPEFTIRAFWQTRDRVLAIMPSERERYRILDVAGEEVAIVSSRLPGPPGDLPTRLQMSGSGFEACPHPDGEKFVIAYRNSAAGRVFSNDGSPLWNLELPPEVVAAGAAGRLSYVDCAVTGSQLFLIYSGVSRDASTEARNSGRSIHSYDWNGRFLGSIALPFPLTGLARVDDGSLVGVSMGTQRILRIDLAEAL